MRFSASLCLAGLAAFASAQEDPFQQYKAQFQNVLDQIGSYVPNPGKHDAAAAAEAKNGPMKMSTLTLENWKQTLYEPVVPGATVPEEWWVLVSGRNKTCFGRCDKVEQAFNETAVKFADLPGAPHMGYINCDDQPILCNSWSSMSATIYVFEMLPPPAPIEIYTKRLNVSSTTSEDLVALHASGNKAEFKPLDSWFHPFNGKAVELGLAVPFGYIMWAFGLVPNWMFMLLVSFGSRRMMSNRMQGAPGAPGAQGAAPRR